ncbi:hypothetical protein C9374_014075 [Naegleria lovaniensis]|uniref:Guanylate cyclase domain-containing protein n=1 Tax=Naegleria lovaniensis TaxID=51637 RepID=A0AA88KN02_NAELO|nr:uncharacterized protein C9374_014075 [Naegleria lovaniensis]KAG2389515.1 hypothetical protein C9374_014075 [Naegleria lovaniensis]
MTTNPLTKSITVVQKHPGAASLHSLRTSHQLPHRSKSKGKSNWCKSACSHLFSIKFCLSLIIILLVLLSTISIFVSTFILQGQAIEKSSLVLGEQTMLRTYESKDNYWFGVSRSINETTGLRYYFIEVFRNNWYYGIFPLSNNFSYSLKFDTPIQQFSLDSFEWWSDSQQAKKNVFSELYATNQDSVWISAYYSVMLNSTNLDYVITTDLTVQDINTYLRSITISPNSRIYLVSSITSEMVACSSQNETLYVFDRSYAHKLQRKELSESTVPDVSLVGKLIKKKYGSNLKNVANSEINKYTVGDNTYLVLMNEVEDTHNLNWKIVIMMSVDDFMDPVTKFRNITLIVDGIVLVLSLVIAVLVSITITTPLHKLGYDMQEIAQLNETEPRKKNPIVFHEVKKLQHHFEKMASAVQAFMKYIPKEIVKGFIIEDNQSYFELGVTQQHIGILFSDIKNFTTICEGSDPRSLISMLGRYFEITSGVVYTNGGVLDKYIGDSLMALFGAPNTFENYVFHCCNAAFEMQGALAPFNEQLEKEGKPTLYTRVGCSCGNVLIGNIGSSYRYSYTCLGDHVNLASRLEGLNKQYGTNIMVSDACHELVKYNFLFRMLDVVAVKGKTQGVKVFEIVDRKCFPGSTEEQHVDPKKVEYCEMYNTIIEEYYLKKQFAVAEKELERYLEKYPNDYAAIVMLERCNLYLKSPPPESWNGVYVATEK